MFYLALKRFVGIFFNILNVGLGGNLPPFACVCVIVEEDGKFLVVERPEGETAFPGGFMRWREQPEQTARRECLEETGLEVEVHEIVSYATISSPAFNRLSTVNLIFRGSRVGGELHPSIEGQPIWLTREELEPRLDGFYLHIYQDYKRYRK
ncbi:DNA mismatch repair protein MutT [Ktedonobacter sp. SOSP1-85]|uniref:NUDIX hydrolase n=1 Tax=Ktedonobacter sp. SOSP1-85 TaxID=2778367 RepID=UPI0019159020|nr:NUDIX hydrolase [Ktedonobacter sp. SOSP1-85]GHO73256.1 DNA mismatch repair protein MutT [Ktedonobacter sp. SOSP1-85]